jgi:protein-disulfide isomerase
MPISRRATSLLATLALMGGIAALSACNNGGSAGGGSTGALSKYENATDIAQGSKDAKVVVVEYASVTCPHCANFHNNVMPVIKEKYVATGKVRFVFREFPTAPVDLAMAGHALARCSGAKRNDVIATIMRQQMDMVTQAQGPIGAKQYFTTLGASVGMNEAAVDACFSNEAVLKTLSDVKDDGEKAGITRTPTFFINGEKFQGPGGREIEAKDMIPALDAAIAKAG